MSKNELLNELDGPGKVIAIEPPKLLDPFLNMVNTAVESGLDIEKITALMDLKDRHDKKESKKSFNFALSRFQSSIPSIKKNGFADFGPGKAKYTYARLDDISTAIKPSLAENGLSYRYEQSVNAGLITVTCIVAHAQGHEITASMSSSPDGSGGKNGIQQTASAMQYMRRYTLTGALGITTADYDDDADESEGAEGQVEEGNFYPQIQFHNNFPIWEKQIQTGKKTPREIIGFLAKIGKELSKQQIEKINDIKELEK